MVEKKRKDLFVDFLALGIIFVFSLMLLISFSNDLSYKKLIIFLTGGCYFWWGIFHHWRQDDLYTKIVLEYLLFSILGISVMLFLI